MTYRARLLLDLMKKHQIENVISYREGRFSLGVDGEEFDQPYEELRKNGFITKEGFLTNKGKQYLYFPNTSKLNPPQVQHIATSCINELAYLVAEKGWKLNGDFKAAISALNDAVFNSGQLTQEPEIESPEVLEETEEKITFVTSVYPPDLPEEEFNLEIPTVTAKPKKSKKK